MTIQQFFEIYQEANKNFDVDALASCYADTFLFGQPQGSQAIRKEDFIRVLPRRKDFFQKTGQKSSVIVSLKENELDEKYIEVKATWEMHYEKEGKSIKDFTYATYILYKTEDTFQIVVQIDHQDLMKRVQELGLLPQAS